MCRRNWISNELPGEKHDLCRFFSGVFRFTMQQVKILVEMIDKLLEKGVYFYRRYDILMPMILEEWKKTFETI